jgi:hypothetical protein
VALPVEAELHLGFVNVVVRVKAGGALTVNVAVFVQWFASVIVQV